MLSSRTMTDCLSMCGVWKSYDAGIRGCSATISVLRDVHLDVAPGEIVAIAAAAASGKTTLLMCAGGMLRPDRGFLSWFGSPPRREVSTRPDGIAFAGDRPFPYGFLTIREAVEYAAIVRDLPLRDSAQRVTDSLERTGLAHQSHRRVDSLDGNALARLSMAAALLARPRLILVDDFAPGCDAETAGEMLAVLRCIASNGAGIVIAGRYVGLLESAAMDSVQPPIRLFALTGGRLESTAERADVAARRATSAVMHTHTRVAEVSPGSAAPENGAR